MGEVGFFLQFLARLEFGGLKLHHIFNAAIQKFPCLVMPVRLVGEPVEQRCAINGREGEALRVPVDIARHIAARPPHAAHRIGRQLRAERHILRQRQDVDGAAHRLLMRGVKFQPEADREGDAIADFEAEHIALLQLRLHLVIGGLDKQADHIRRAVRKGEIKHRDIDPEIGGRALHRCPAPAIKQHMRQHRVQKPYVPLAFGLFRHDDTPKKPVFLPRRTITPRPPPSRYNERAAR